MVGLWGPLGYSIEPLSSEEVIASAPPRFTQAGVFSLKQQAYLLTKRRE